MTDSVSEFRKFTRTLCGIILILINDEECPIAIRPLYWIGGNQRCPAPSWISLKPRKPDGLGAGLQPLEINQLACEELTERLSDLPIRANCKHPKGSIGVVATACTPIGM